MGGIELRLARPDDVPRSNSCSPPSGCLRWRSRSSFRDFWGAGERRPCRRLRWDRDLRRPGGGSALGRGRTRPARGQAKATAWCVMRTGLRARARRQARLSVHDARRPVLRSLGFASVATDDFEPTVRESWQYVGLTERPGDPQAGDSDAPCRQRIGRESRGAAVRSRLLEDLDTPPSITSPTRHTVSPLTRSAPTTSAGALGATGKSRPPDVCGSKRTCSSVRDIVGEPYFFPAR